MLKVLVMKSHIKEDKGSRPRPLGVCLSVAYTDNEVSYDTETLPPDRDVMPIF